MPCSELADITHSQCENTSQKDAFCVFLRTHLCICSRIVNHYIPARTPALLQLNKLFIDILLSVNKNFVESKEQHNVWWDRAFHFYAENPHDYFQGLVMMVAAHIIGDLPLALSALSEGGVEIDKNDYDDVLFHILHCVKKEGISVGSSFTEQVLSFIQKRVDPECKLTVKQMREYAWREYLRIRARNKGPF